MNSYYSIIMHPQGEKIQKFLAAAGLGSRRHCETLVAEGRVTLNGTPVGIGDRVIPKDKICLDGQKLRHTTTAFWKLFKPRGWLCTDDTSHNTKRARDLLPRDAGRLFAVGRLDRDFEGMVLFSNNGDIAHRLTHPRYGVDKIYEVRIASFVPDEALAKLHKGLWLSEGRTAPVVPRISRRSSERTVLTLKLSENRRRLIPRVFAKIGHPVERVKRIGIGPIRLQGLQEGESRRLDRHEVRALESLLET